jgi:hypothetical protein
MSSQQTIEATVAGLIAKYPTRWGQAVSNPSLRNWFVIKAMKECGLREQSRGRPCPTLLISARTGGSERWRSRSRHKTTCSS